MAQRLGWTEERTALLKKMWADGLSASQCAARLGGGATRNSCIAKVHRLGLSGRATNMRLKTAKPRPSRPPHARPPKPTSPFAAILAKAPALPDEPPPAHEPDLVIPIAERKQLVDLTETCCRWPFGDPRHHDFHFCGKGKVTGLPYCEFHARRAYQVPPVRTRADPTIARRRRVRVNEFI